VQFQITLNRTKGGQLRLLETNCHNADRLASLREGLFTGKYLNTDASTVKLVFSPAQGQTQPAQQQPRSTVNSAASTPRAVRKHEYRA
jgi:predicted nucleotide-binding protein